jgi:hypothetical protein
MSIKYYTLIKGITKGLVVLMESSENCRETTDGPMLLFGDMSCKFVPYRSKGSVNYLISCSKICLPKEQGGLGFKNMCILNQMHEKSLCK